MSESKHDLSDSDAMLRMIAGFWLTQAIYVAAKLGIADLLGNGPKPIAMLASQTETHERSLYRVLRTLAAAGVFVEDEGRFDLTPMAMQLRRDVVGSLRPYAIMMGEQWAWRSLGEMLHSVRTGQSGFEHIFGATPFDYSKNHPGAARIGTEGVTSRSAPENDAVVSAYDFGNIETIVDVGGGQGTLITRILGANPRARGLLFDMPHMAGLARPVLVQAGLIHRCEFQAGNFFASVPSGGGIYIMKKVLHDWDDDRALEILQNCRAAIPAHGLLLLVELVVPAQNEPSFSKMLDLLMLTYVGGQERTEGEYRHLVTAAGFQLQRVLTSNSTVSIIEAVPA